MKYLLIIFVLAVFDFPAAAQTLSVPTQAVTKDALQAEQARDNAAIQRQHDQIEGLTRHMLGLKAQLDSLREQLGEDSAATDQVGGRVNQASKQKYGVRLRR